MTSAYKNDRGNGVVIYADDYVQTGKWVFDCDRSRLINRSPLAPPIVELEQAGRLTIGDMYDLSVADKDQAEAAIRALTGIDNWYEDLHYLYSSLGESNELNVHVFDLHGRYNGRSWALKVRQRLDQGRSSFTIRAEPYDPETYVDHAAALKTAVKSCSTPQ